MLCNKPATWAVARALGKVETRILQNRTEAHGPKGSSDVVTLLLDRQRSNSAPGKRTDGRTVALVVEGGAMRGVVSAGMVAALEQLGMKNCFDVVYGSSAGAISGAYFVAEQARYGTTIFYDNINNRKFINLWRILLGKPIVSLEFLLDRVCVHEKPLAFDRVLGSSIPLRVLASSLREKRATILKSFSSREELIEALRASARIPFFAGKPVPFRDDHYLDASMYESIPYRAAIADGATDVVILLTRPSGDLRSVPNWTDRNIIAPYLSRMDQDLSRHYLDRANEYREEISEITVLASGKSAVRALLIQTEAEAKKVRPLERVRSKLVAGAMDGYRAVYAGLDLPIPKLAEMIAPIEMSSYPTISQPR